MRILKYVLLFSILAGFCKNLQAFPFTFREFFKWYELTYRPLGDRYVYVNDVVEIQLMPVDKPRKVYTSDLDGCSSTILFQKSKRKTKRAVLTHYHPRSKQDHLVSLATHAPWQDEEIVQCVCVFVLPEDRRINTFAFEDRAQHLDNCEEERAHLEQTIIASFPQTDVEILHLDYGLVISSKDMSTSAISVCLSNEEPSFFCIDDAGKAAMRKFNLE